MPMLYPYHLGLSGKQLETSNYQGLWRSLTKSLEEVVDPVEGGLSDAVVVDAVVDVDVAVACRQGEQTV